MRCQKMCVVADVVLIGATGMVGSAVVAQSQRPIALLARRPGRWPDAVDAVVAPSDEWPTAIAGIGATVLINCLGTTIAQAGSQAAFRATDHDLVLAVARAAYAAGAKRMICVSSVGANAVSRNYYLRTKGELEAELRAIGFDRLDIIRPGLLIGDRQGPRRVGEAIGMALAPLTDALMLGGLRRYRSVAATTVARAILALAEQSDSGHFVHEHDAIVALAD
jgi:uncharacterized protein YbjT (DUF2867 family)